MAARLHKEKQLLEKQNFYVEIVDQNTWKITIVGPQQSPFEGGHFVLKFVIDGFPFKAPIVTFDTQIYHPNVDKNGEICPELLNIGQKWAPIRNLVKVMFQIRHLLTSPNLSSAYNLQAAVDYKNGTWQQKAKQLTKKYVK